MRTLCSAVLPLVLMVIATPRATAQEDVDDARTHYQAGRSYYEQLRYADAAREFEEAYRLSGRPHLLKNVAVSHQHAENWEEAIATYERYLREAPDTDDQREIEARIARLREIVASGAEEDPEGSEGDADRDLAADTPSDRPEEGGGFPTATVVTLGAGVAFGVGALITGLVAHGIYQDLESNCPMDSCFPEEEASRDQGQTMAVASTALLAAAGAAGIVAVVFFFTVDSNDEAPPETATMRLAPGPGELGASMQVRF